MVHLNRHNVFEHRQLAGIFRWFFDEAVPQYVKSTYLPKRKSKRAVEGFTVQDLNFFARSVNELHELLTEEREFLKSRERTYFQQPKFRSAYLLYFFPQQAARMLQVQSAYLSPSSKILDLGAGPGTASISWLLLMAAGIIPPQKLQFTWVDPTSAILNDGMALVEILVQKYPALKGLIEINAVSRTFEGVARSAVAKTPWDMIFAGHFLNESTLSPEDACKWLSCFFHSENNPQILLTEPASQHSSQFLSQLRDEILRQYPKYALSGPCPHSGLCPLSRGRDYCHFRVLSPQLLKWVPQFSRKMDMRYGRQMKLSFVALGAPASLDPKQTLVISDPIETKNNKDKVLLCAPNRPNIGWVPSTSRTRRGDWIKSQIQR